MPTAEELVERHLAAGAEHYEAGRLEDALAEWREALRADPLDADAQYNLGLGLSDSGVPEQAALHWREALRLRPDFFEPHFHLACTLAEKANERESDGLWRELLQHCRAALDLRPEAPVQEAYLLRLLAVAEWNLGSRSKAISTMRAAVAVEPDLWTYEQLSQMQARTGQWRASVATFNEMAELFDYDPSRYDECCHRLRLMGSVVLLGICALLVWTLTRRR